MTDRGLTVALAGSATAAATAPSIRRSQPWRIVLHTASLDVYADARAELTREETLLTCGAAVHRARLSLAADGLAVQVVLLPDADPDHVARLTPAGRLATEPARGLPRGDARLVTAARTEGAELRLLAPAEASRLAGTLLATPAPATGQTTYGVLYGRDGSAAAWIRAGQALSAIELAAADAGLSLLASAAAVELSRSQRVLRDLLPAGATPFAGLRLQPTRPT
jgi:hypothetical protein